MSKRAIEVKDRRIRVPGVAIAMRVDDGAGHAAHGMTQEAQRCARRTQQETWYVPIRDACYDKGKKEDIFYRSTYIW